MVGVVAEVRLAVAGVQLVVGVALSLSLPLHPLVIAGEEEVVAAAAVIPVAEEEAVAVKAPI